MEKYKQTFVLRIYRKSLLQHCVHVQGCSYFLLHINYIALYKIFAYLKVYWYKVKFYKNLIKHKYYRNLLRYN